MMDGKKQKPVDELKMPADAFDAIMRQALGVSAPAAKQSKEPAQEQGKLRESHKK